MDSKLNGIKELIDKVKSNDIPLNIPNELPGQNILNDTLLNVNEDIKAPNLPTMESYNMNDMGECPYSHKKGKISGCPFLNAANTEISSRKFDYHYEINVPESVFDFRFNALNYSKENYEKAKWLREMPKHLRNTLMLQNPKIIEIRGKEYSVIFLTCEEIKQKAHQFYKEKKYEQALGVYNIIYGILKWLSFKDKEKGENFRKKFDFSKESGIIDDDIELRRINTDPNYSYEEGSYKTYIINILKGIAYCHMNLRHYSEAEKCMDEALGYSKASKPDILLRRAQSIMYNKFSPVEKLEKALNDLKEAESLKKDDKLIEEHLSELNSLINEKKYRNVANIKKLLDEVTYANNVIKKKNLNVRDHIYHSYDDIHFNHKIVKEMVETYFSSVKFFQDTKNEKELKRIMDEYDKFFDFYFPYNFYYNLNLTKLKENVLNLFPDEDKQTINLCINDPTMHLLFNDFRLKKCQDLYDDMDWNITFWKFCFKTVNEREKKEREERKKREPKKSFFDWKILKQPFSNLQYGLFTIIFVMISLLILGLHVMYFKDDNNAQI
jgi:hypothetical protein